ncbi:2Fe-2S iron-sulfur cluster-binding protein [Duganella flavida]|uniref:2Fe-2S iron-sulfur cluster-binding protein n=1 Tax=Duganella flavida TaxID=2692175 RepID=UPI003530B013
MTAQVNGLPVTIQAGETLLQAALRSGIAFPHSCRVGGCATCKCRLLSGRVKELTRPGYVLSDDELERGYILACQSVALTDIAVEVDLSAQQARSKVAGRVIGQQRLTHDITQLRIQLSESLQYKAGQFAQLSLAPLGELERSYSFATPVQPDAQVQFFIRKVVGGALSTLVNERSVVGEEVVVDGPLGDFWLRPADAPLLFIAGGSGLAPVLAVLRDALHASVRRPATLLFGAREEHDLYALEEIKAIAQDWRAAFEFVPVLSGAAADSSWKGRRGMVGDYLAQHATPESHAYLCGPPAMIDACSATLAQCGVDSKHIHADRFTTIWGDK